MQKGPAMTGLASHPTLFIQPGTVIANYRIHGQLAAGGMAEVFAAQHVVLPRKVALKIMHAQWLRLDGMTQRFMREACILETFIHPGSIRVFECGLLPDGRPWMAMELVEGEPLSHRIAARVDPAEACGLLAAMGETLAAAHEAGFIHRDLKPDNILLPSDPEAYPVRIIDWGLALQGGLPRLTQDGSASGTPLYMAPEQAQGKELDRNCDVYSLGVVAYEMLTGVAPFDGANLVEIVVRHLTTTPPPVHELRPEIPLELSELVAHMLAKDPAQRPSAADVATRAAWIRAMVPSYESLELSSPGINPTALALMAGPDDDLDTTDATGLPAAGATTTTGERPTVSGVSSTRALDSLIDDLSLDLDIDIEVDIDVDDLEEDAIEAEQAQAAAAAAAADDEDIDTVVIDLVESMRRLPAGLAVAVAPSNPRVRWTPEPGVLTPLAREARARQPITPRGGYDQVSGEILVRTR
jgi:tRNA A-37 threonylcarbamoyl transferase component Bud32